MIKLNYLFEKNAIHNKSESVVSLVQFSGTKNNIKTEKRKLNISIAIDISGSMDVAIKTERVIKTRKVLKNRNPYINIPMFDILKENYWDKKEYEIEEEYESFISMDLPCWNKIPGKSYYKINYIKDSGTEYNGDIMINWYRKIKC